MPEEEVQSVAEQTEPSPEQTPVEEPGVPDTEAKLRELQEQLDAKNREGQQMAEVAVRAAFDSEARKEYRNDPQFRRYAEMYGLNIEDDPAPAPAAPASDFEEESVDPRVASLEKQLSDLNRQLKPVLGFVQETTQERHMERLKNDDLVKELTPQAREEVVINGLARVKAGMAVDARDGIRQSLKLMQTANQPAQPVGEPPVAPPQTIPAGMGSAPPPQNPTILTTSEGRKDAKERALASLQQHRVAGI